MKYTVKMFDEIRAADVQLMRWDLDLGGDKRVNGRQDACVMLRPTEGSDTLSAGLYRGCTGDAIATTDAKSKRKTLKIRFLVDELRLAGLDEGTDAYRYRFSSLARDGSSDEVPDDLGALIRHQVGTSERTRQQPNDPIDDPGSSEDVVDGQSATVTPAGGEQRADGGAQAAQAPTASPANADGTPGIETRNGQVVTGATGTATQASPTASPATATQPPASAAPVVAGPVTGTGLPTTGPSNVMLFAGIGTVGLSLGGAMVIARRRLKAIAAAEAAEALSGPNHPGP